MKKIFFLIVYLVLDYANIEAQCPWNTSNINTPWGSTVKVFDWTVDKYYVYTRTNQAVADEIWSPFSSFANPDANVLAFMSASDKDNKPEDGWELISKNFGAPNDPYPNPTLILYNRFAAIMRVFVYVPQNSSFDRNTAKIDIKFVRSETVLKESALLAPLSTPLERLEDFEKKIASTTVQRTQMFGLFWMYADIPVAYDPCSCEHFTTIEVTPSFINLQEVNLFASGEEKKLMTEGASTNNFGSEISHTLDVVAKGTETIKKRGTQVGTTVGTIGSFIKDYVAPFYKSTTRISTLGPDDTPPTDGTDPVITVVQTALPLVLGALAGPEAAQAGKIIGSALGAIEFFSTSGKATATASPSNMINYSIKGEIKDSIIGQFTRLYNPGSAWQSNPMATLNKSKPVYNNTLGTFAVIDLPVLESSTELVSNGSFNGFDTPAGTMGHLFKLASTSMPNLLTYVINPASGLKKEPKSIMGYWLIKVKASHAGSNVGAEFIIPPSMIRNDKNDGSEFSFQSPLMPLNCLKDFIGRVDAINYSLYNVEAYLGLVVDMERIDRPDKSVVYIAQYKIPFKTGNNLSISNFNDNVLSNTANYVVIDDLELENDREVRAWQTVTINGNINTNGHKITITSGSDIMINGNQALNPDIDLKIEYPYNCGSTILYPISTTEVGNFCKSGRYNPVVANTLIVEDTPETMRLANKVYDLATSPNPFKDELFISFELSETEQVRVFFTNTMGQVVQTAITGTRDKGLYEETINTQALAAGVYYLTLETSQGRKTVKVLKSDF